MREARLAVETAPGQAQPEIAMGDALAAAGQKDEAREHYGAALTKVGTMNEGARQTWEKTVRDKVSGCSRLCAPVKGINFDSEQVARPQPSAYTALNGAV